MISSVELKFFDKNLSPSFFNATFTSSLGFSANAAWALNTFFVISGTCNPSCYTCDFSYSPTACLTCVGLLSQATDRSCSVCGAGRYVIAPSQCGLCPISCVLCSSSTGTLLCTSCPITMTLTASGNCEYSAASNSTFLLIHRLLRCIPRSELPAIRFILLVHHSLPFPEYHNLRDLLLRRRIRHHLPKLPHNQGLQQPALPRECLHQSQLPESRQNQR